MNKEEREKLLEVKRLMEETKKEFEELKKSLYKPR